MSGADYKNKTSNSIIYLAFLGALVSGLPVGIASGFFHKNIINGLMDGTCMGIFVFLMVLFHNLTKVD
jgi:hypothetical protein